MIKFKDVTVHYNIHNHLKLCVGVCVYHHMMFCLYVKSRNSSILNKISRHY